MIVLSILVYVMIYTRFGFMLRCGLDQDPTIAKKYEHHYFFFARDKIFKMRIKNLPNISDKINQLSYALIKKKN